MTDKTAIIFDLDGTLIHSAPDLQAALNVALRAHGRAEVDLERTISFIGNGVEKLVERGLRATGTCTAEIHESALADFRRFYDVNTTTLTRPYPGVLDMLERLHRQGHVMGICTNKPTQPALDICTALDIAQYFDVIQGAEPDLPRKPDPAPLLHTVTTMGAMVHNALYVGDSEVDYGTAQNAVIPFALFTKGYLHHPLPDLPALRRFDSWDHFSPDNTGPSRA